LTRLTQEELNKQFPGRYVVKLGMRYGEPSIERVMAEFAAEGVDRIRVLPLFPQYASATVGSAIEEVYRVANANWNMPTIEALPPFYDHSGYLDAFASVTREAVKLADYEYYLFSFHGLPERQIKKGESPGEDRCLTDSNCCATICMANRNCYRAQCYATARGIAERLNLPPEQWSVSFQSRLGNEPWIRPYTDEVMKELPGKGIKSLAVLSPAFVADCLETLEELGIRGEEDFTGAGGERFKMIPSLNLHTEWVDTVVSLVSDRADKSEPKYESVN
jgi:ferrochelatase